MSEPIRLGYAPRRPFLIPVLARIVARWAERRRTRRALADLDAHLLRDIGVSLERARRESKKPFWL